MIIKLIGDLEQELCSLGLKPGDEIGAVKDSVSKVGAMNFDVYKNGSTYHCVVWPENYEILTNPNTQTMPSPWMNCDQNFQYLKMLSIKAFSG